jgi:hypothetical protein
MRHIIALGTGMALGGVAGLLLGIFAAAWMIGAATRKSMTASRQRRGQQVAPYKIEIDEQQLRRLEGQSWVDSRGRVRSQKADAVRLGL